MSEALEVRAETLKLARLLQCEPPELAYLEQVPASDLRALRDQVTERLFAAHDGTFTRLAAASKLLPPALIATMGERAFGPLLAARIAGRLDPGRAAETAAKLPPSFLADISVELDPRRASAVIGQIPARRVAEVTAELARREEYVTIGRFVGHVQADALAAALATLDDRELLQIAFVLEDKDWFDDLVSMLGPKRLHGVIDAAASDGLWPEALDLLSNLSEARRAEVVELASAEDDAVLDSLVAAAQADGLWAAVLPIAGVMSPTARQRFAELGAIQADGVIEAIVRAAVADDLWGELLPLVPLLPEAGQERVAAAAAELALRSEERAAIAAALASTT